ncbi:class I SAM-dependent methyltransferase [Pedosphaera parvula]|uniref:Methyltransferase type 11 n=1 Tax=Pedosphaera parvula (strain Ellin514) TaxID=320771 RepID=B9XKS5_PEDPL|nr:class I SAM-dependent methyltransferase [Pedosphaera parvula]EEF59568.1 Methyltransferase type 11 [Pedosphaera parvula Ellin514]
MSANDPQDLKRIYETRFESTRQYRSRVWSILLGDFFQKYIGSTETVLDLGCGYGEFINQVQCGKRYAMDLNPNAPGFLEKSVTFLEQDCSQKWQLPEGSLNVVFTSNFFEHLPDKAALGRTLDEARRCLAPGGRLIAMGPNIKYLPGKYWEFWDHHLALTEESLKEAVTTRGFQVDRCEGRFLPYTMVNSPEYPLVFLRTYLKLRPAWSIFGKQFLVIARKP